MWVPFVTTHLYPFPYVDVLKLFSGSWPKSISMTIQVEFFEVLFNLSAEFGRTARYMFILEALMGRNCLGFLCFVYYCDSWQSI